MNVDLKRQKGQEAARRVFQRKLIFLWARWGRRILLLVLAVSLGIFLAVLPAGARRSLLFSILAQRSVIILLLVLNLVILSLLWTSGERLDAWVFLFINMRGWHPAWLDRGMLLFTQLGNGLFSLSGALLFYLLGERRLSAEMVLGTLSLWLVVETIKALTDRARPYILLEEARVVGLHQPGHSFPSGHTSQVFFLATFLSRYFSLHPLAIFILYLLAVLVGLTRMYVGAHYPRDVGAGALLGSVWGIMLMLIDSLFIARGI